jgi:hypothetical protein
MGGSRTPTVTDYFKMASEPPSQRQQGHTKHWQLVRTSARRRVTTTEVRGSGHLSMAMMQTYAQIHVQSS